MAMVAGTAAVSTATVGAGIAAATGAPLSCDVLYSVNGDKDVAKRIDPTTGTATNSFPVKGEDANQLGIAPGGMYAVYTSGKTIYKYDPLSGETTDVRHRLDLKGTHGAIDPTTGIFYFGGRDDGDEFKFGSYDPATGVVSTSIITATLEDTPGGNGDLAFDATGNMYVVAADDSEGRVYRIAGPITPTSDNLTGTPVTEATDAFVLSNSIAFGPSGYLYVGSSSKLVRVDPSTGSALQTFTKAGGMTDMGSCTDPVTIELHKNLPDGRVGSDDQFALAITGNGLSTGNTATTSGGDGGLQDAVAGPVLGLSGRTYSIEETPQNGADLANYLVSWECIDAKTSEQIASGEGPTGTVTVPGGSNGKSISCTFTNASLQSGLELEKTAAPNTPADFAVGNTVTYSFKMTNTGAVPLRDVTPVEEEFTGTGAMSDFTCPEGAENLAPEQSVTCTATYVLQQEDIDRGTLDNTATATGTDPGGDPVDSNESSVPLVGGSTAPGIVIEKTAAPKAAEDFKLGQTIKYSFKITNTGDVTLRNVTVEEGTFTGSGPLSEVTCPETAASLAPQASVTCTAEYTLTQADIDAGRIENTATATGTPPGTETPIESPPGDETVEGNPTSSLSIVKDASPSTTADYTVGQEISYTFLIKNTGDVTLTDVQPVETDFSGSADMSAFACPAEAASLAPGASVTCTAQYTLTQADIDAGELENIAIATGTSPSGDPVESDPSDKTLSGEPAPAITLEKTAEPMDPDKFVVDETVTYNFVITNTGNVTLTDVHPNETAFTGAGPMSEIACPDAAKSLAPNESVTCTATYTLTQADVDTSRLDNEATATGTPPSGQDVTSDPDEVKLWGNQQPELEIVKTASPRAVEDFKVGNEITYTFDIRNTGNQTLTNVGVVEGDFSGSGELSDVSCPDDAQSLAPGASVSCTATYTLTQDDINAGTLDNVATATGTPPGTEEPIESPQDEENLAGDPTSGLTLEKTAEPSTNVQVGDVVTYRFTITNTGDQTLTDVTVKENQFSGAGPLSDITCPDDARSLDPDESVTCEATYTFTIDDMNVGTVENTATATGTPPSGTPIDSDPSDATVTGEQQPQLEIVKSASLTSLDGFKAGAQVTYSFAITNTGNVTMSNVGVKEGDFSGTGEITDLTCPDGALSLAPGQQVTCTALYELTQADVDAGKVENTASAIGTPPGTEEPIESPPSDGGIEGTPNPDLSIVKTASISDSAEFTVGREITYSFVITNTGDVTMTDVRPNEKAFTGSGPMSDPICEAGASSLAPNDSVTCTATYTLTQADIDAGKLDNVATATGTPPGTEEPIESPESEVSLPGHPHPGISIVKKANPREKVRLGQEVTYRFVITNVGDVTLTNVRVDEGEFTGTGTMSEVTCPAGAASLAPKESVACTATYVVTRADVKNGRIDNVATAVGTNPQDGEVVSEPSNETVTPDKSTFPGLIIIPIIPGLVTGSLGSVGSLGSAGSTGSGGDPVDPGVEQGPSGESDPSGEGEPSGRTPDSETESRASDPKGGRIDAGLGADSDGGMNAGLVGGGLALLAVAGGVLLIALRRRNANGSEE